MSVKSFLYIGINLCDKFIYNELQWTRSCSCIEWLVLILVVLSLQALTNFGHATLLLLLLWVSMSKSIIAEDARRGKDHRNEDCMIQYYVPLENDQLVFLMFLDDK